MCVHLVFLSESLLFQDYYSLHIVIVDVSTSEFIDLCLLVYITLVLLLKIIFSASWNLKIIIYTFFSFFLVNNFEDKRRNWRKKKIDVRNDEWKLIICKKSYTYFKMDTYYTTVGILFEYIIYTFLIWL